MSWLTVSNALCNAMFSMQCNRDAGALFENVLWLCLLLIDVSGSLKILYKQCNSQYEEIGY